MIHYSLIDIYEELGLESVVVNQWVEWRLITPMDKINFLFDQEDLERMRLIQSLIVTHDLNYESLEIILHLIDQIHSLQDEIKRISAKLKE